MSFRRVVALGSVAMVAAFAATARGQGGPDVDPDPLHALMVDSRLAVDPNDEHHWVGVADDAAGERWFTTFDGGMTWSTGLLPSPVLAYLGAVVINLDGSVLAVATDFDLDAGVRSYRSDDGGLTWTLKGSVGGGSYPDLAIDLSGGPHHGRIALVWVPGASTFGSWVSCQVSDDGGKTWLHGQTIFSGPHEFYGAPSVAFGPQSELWVGCVRGFASEIWVNHSGDGGATFDGQILASTYVPTPGTLWDGTVVYDFFSIAVDASNGPYSDSVYLAYHAWDTTNQRADVRCLRSTDGGATWTDTLVNQGATTLSDQFMPRATVDSHGSLVVAFLDRRLDPSDVLLWTWLAASSDGGTTFREYPLSDVGWDPSTTFNSAGKFLGMAAGDHGVGALFPDGRSGQLDVLWDHANLSLVATPAQISAAAGNAVAFDLGLGPNDGGGTYWLLGSLATSPPFVVGDATVDLALDPLFFFLLQVTNTPNFANAMGTLDSQGHAIATLDPKGPFNPALVGTNLYFAAVNPVPGSEFATASIQVTIVP